MCYTSLKLFKSKERLTGKTLITICQLSSAIFILLQCFPWKMYIFGSIFRWHNITPSTKCIFLRPQRQQPVFQQVMYNNGNIPHVSIAFQTEAFLRPNFKKWFFIYICLYPYKWNLSLIHTLRTHTLINVLHFDLHLLLRFYLGNQGYFLPLKIPTWKII